jgi:hypothetical protein
VRGKTSKIEERTEFEEKQFLKRTEYEMKYTIESMRYKVDIKAQPHKPKINHLKAL